MRIFYMSLLMVFVIGLSLSVHARDGFEYSNRDVYMVVFENPDFGKWAGLKKGLSSSMLLSEWKSVVARNRSKFFDELSPILRKHSTLAISIREQYSMIPVVSMKLSPELVGRIESLPSVVHVGKERVFYKMDVPAYVKFLRAPEFWSVSGGGDGVSVAVLDTGIEFLGDAFGTCERAGDDGCSVILSLNFAGPDGPTPELHGTLTAGIVHNVAPKASIIAIDVFTYTGNPPPYDYNAFEEDTLEALNWTIEHREEYNIVAVNMSLGGGGFSRFCDEYSSYGDGSAIKILYEMGTLTAIASGNEGMRGRISYPACLYPAVAVGACMHSGSMRTQVASFSNQSSIVAFVAPGMDVGGGDVAPASGTSMAAPNVAGAIALWASVLSGSKSNEELSEAVLANLFFTANESILPGYDAEQWSWPLLQVPPAPEVMEFSLIQFSKDSNGITISTPTEYSFEVNANGAVGVERLLLWADYNTGSNLMVPFTLTAPDGTEFSGNLPQSSSGAARAILGSFRMPELSDRFHDAQLDGTWNLKIMPPSGHTLNLRTLHVAMLPIGVAPVVLNELSPIAQDSKMYLPQPSFALVLDSYNMSVNSQDCTATLTTTAPTGEELTLQQSITLATGQNASTVYAMLPDDVPDGTYVFKLELGCTGARIEPEEPVRAEFDLELSEVEVGNVHVIGSSIVRSVQEVVTLSYEHTHQNPWQVCCTESISFGEGIDDASPISSSDVCFNSSERIRNLSIPASSFWSPNSDGYLFVTLECPPHMVKNTRRGAQVFMMTPPSVEISSSISSGPAPLEVDFEALIDGEATEIKWQFGDGQSASGKKVSHTYKLPGQYTAMVIASNRAGNSKDFITIVVTEQESNGSEPTSSVSNDTSSGGCTHSNVDMWVVVAMLLMVSFAHRKRLHQ